MLEPNDIVDPSDKLLEDKRGTTNRALWVIGGAVCTLSTLIFAISSVPWDGPVSVATTQSMSEQGAQKTPPPSKVDRPPMARSLAQSPKALQPEVGSAAQIAQTRKPPAPGSKNHQRAEENSTAERGGVSSSTSQHAPPVVDPAQANPGPEAVAETPEITEERLQVTSAASIYSGPSDSADVIGTAHPGAEGVVASRKSEWVEIVDTATGKTGWINSAFLAPVSEDAASTETALPIEQDLDVPDGEALSATVEPKPRAKAKNYRSKSRYGRRPIRRLRSALRRFRR